jgi:hypothetical protein
MTYINKQIALDTAFNMLKPTRDAIEAKKNELMEITTALVEDSIPEDVMVLLKKLPEGWIIEKILSNINNFPD